MLAPTRAVDMFHGLDQDVRLAFRAIRRSPAFAAIVIVTIALATGANTAVFSVFNALVLKPLAVREPSRLVVLTPIEEPGTAARFVYAATLEQLRGGQQIFDRLSLYSGGGALRTEVRGAAVDAGVEGVDPEYFEIVGARPALGRLLIPSDALGRTGAPSVVIGDRFWRQQFGSDPRAVGESIRIDGTPMTSVGVGRGAARLEGAAGGQRRRSIHAAGDAASDRRRHDAPAARAQRYRASEAGRHGRRGACAIADAVAGPCGRGRTRATRGGPA